MEDANGEIEEFQLISPSKINQLQNTFHTIQDSSLFFHFETSDLLRQAPNSKVQKQLKKYPNSTLNTTYHSSPGKPITLDPQQLIKLQKWIMIYSHEFKLREYRKRAYQQLIEQQAKKNLGMIEVIKNLNKNIQKKREKIKKAEAKERKIKEREVRSLKKQLNDSRYRAERLNQEIYYLRRSLSHQKQKKKKKQSKNKEHLRYNSCNSSHNQPSYQHIPYEYFHISQHPQRFCDFQPPSSQISNSQPISHINSYSISLNPLNLFKNTQKGQSPDINLQRVKNTDHVSEEDKEQKNLQKSRTNEEHQDKNQNLGYFLGSRKYNLMSSKKIADDSSKRPPISNKDRLQIENASQQILNQSEIDIDVPAEDSFNQKSQNSIKKQTTERKKIQEIPLKHKFKHDNSTLFHKDKFEKSQIMNRKNINNSKKEIVFPKQQQPIEPKISQKSLQNSQKDVYLTNKVRKSSQNKESYESQLGDEDLLNISLLTVSKISKQKKISLKKIIEEDQNQLHQASSYKSTIYTRNKPPISHPVSATFKRKKEQAIKEEDLNEIEMDVLRGERKIRSARFENKEKIAK